MTSEAIVVRADHVERLTLVQTTAADEWRAAVELRGEIDIACAGALRDELTAHIDAGRRVIRVDSEAVDFIDSTAMGVLIDASERCRAEHGSLILTNVPARMRRIITIAGLETVLLVDNAGQHRKPA